MQSILSNATDSPFLLFDMGYAEKYLTQYRKSYPSAFLQQENIAPASHDIESLIENFRLDEKFLRLLKM